MNGSGTTGRSTVVLQNADPAISRRGAVSSSDCLAYVTVCTMSEASGGVSRSASGGGGGTGSGGDGGSSPSPPDATLRCVNVECNKVLPLGSRFCQSCGTKQVVEADGDSDKASCFNCGTPLFTPKAVFCHVCGARDPMSSQPSEVNSDKPPPALNFKKSLQQQQAQVPAGLPPSDAQPAPQNTGERVPEQQPQLPAASPPSSHACQNVGDFTQHYVGVQQAVEGQKVESKAQYEKSQPSPCGGHAGGQPSVRDEPSGEGGGDKPGGRGEKDRGVSDKSTDAGSEGVQANRRDEGERSDTMTDVKDDSGSQRDKGSGGMSREDQLSAGDRGAKETNNDLSPTQKYFQYGAAPPPEGGQQTSPPQASGQPNGGSIFPRLLANSSRPQNTVGGQRVFGVLHSQPSHSQQHGVGIPNVPTRGVRLPPRSTVVTGRSDNGVSPSPSPFPGRQPNPQVDNVQGGAASNASLVTHTPSHVHPDATASQADKDGNFQPSVAQDSPKHSLSSELGRRALHDPETSTTESLSSPTETTQSTMSNREFSIRITQGHVDTSGADATTGTSQDTGQKGQPTAPLSRKRNRTENDQGSSESEHSKQLKTDRDASADHTSMQRTQEQDSQPSHPLQESGDGEVQEDGSSRQLGSQQGTVKEESAESEGGGSHADPAATGGQVSDFTAIGSQNVVSYQYLGFGNAVNTICHTQY